MPSAISRPSEPVETTSMSIDLSFLPSRMIEPLPKLRSIWESAASRAFVLSMDDPSTRRSAAAPALMIRAPYGRDSEGQQRSGPCPAMLRQHCTRSVLCSQYVLFLRVCIYRLGTNCQGVPPSYVPPTSPRIGECSAFLTTWIIEGRRGLPLLAPRSCSSSKRDCK